MALFTDDQVRDIRRRADEGECGFRIAKDLGVDHTIIYNIINRLFWKHIEGGIDLDTRPGPRGGARMFGENSGSAKLTDDDVREIRRLDEIGDTTQQALADRYGVTQGAIGYICRGVTWKHIEGGSKRNRKAKVLTEDDVREIRALHASGTMSQAAIARKLCVSPATVCHIVNRHQWAHVI